MISAENLTDIANGGGDVLTTDGNKIGSIGQLYVDDETGRPNWVTAKTGLFGTGESFVPLGDATIEGNDIVVPYSKDKVKDAPRVDADGHLSEEEQDGLYQYYEQTGRTRTTADTDHRSAGAAGTVTDRNDDDGAQAGVVGAGTADEYETTRTAGHDTLGQDAGDAMTRSEERLNIDTQARETGRARLRKYIVTENVTKTVPVSHEEVRIEREPITEDSRGAGVGGADLSEEEHEVTLHSERPVVEKETVPVERIHLTTETVTGEETVNEEVRKEKISTDGVDDTSADDTDYGDTGSDRRHRS